MQGHEIHGTFTLNGITFSAGYRFGGHLYHQGGYSQCLRIYDGKQANGIAVSGHDYFGDDKFEVVKASDYVGDMVLELSFPLHKEGEYNYNASKTVILVKKSNKN